MPQLLESPAFYLGLIGPKRRTGRLMTELHSRGLMPRADALARLHTPAGLDLGGDAPESVALSVIAEIEATANGRRGGPLADRKGSIHYDAPVATPKEEAIA